MIGKTIGHYHVTAVLGRGGMGEVYQARDSQLHREVAIKVLPAAFENDSESVARLKREARVLASLSHPGIAAIYGLEGNALVMELVPGLTLAERLARGQIPDDEAQDLAVQLAKALAYAHGLGVIHRDLKPANM